MHACNRVLGRLSGLIASTYPVEGAVVGEPKPTHSTWLQPRALGWAAAFGLPGGALSYPPGSNFLLFLSFFSFCSQIRGKEKETERKPQFKLHSTDSPVPSGGFYSSIQGRSVLLPGHPLLSWVAPFPALSSVRAYLAGLERQSYLGPLLTFNPFWPNVGFVYSITVPLTLLTCHGYTASQAE